MTGKRDVREEMAEAAEHVLGEPGHGPCVLCDLASRVLRHEAGAETKVLICSTCGLVVSNPHTINHGSTCHSDKKNRGEMCYGTLTELIERYRGEE